MGYYDCYEEIQIKVNPSGKTYKLGDKVEIDDGVYLGYEGVIVILGGQFIAKVDVLYDKWGGVIEPNSIIDRYNPVQQEIINILNSKERVKEEQDGTD